MQQVKLFMGLEGDTEELTKEINNWIRDSSAKVIQISGNIAPQSMHAVEQGHSLPAVGTLGGRPPSDILVIILYTH